MPLAALLPAVASMGMGLIQGSINDNRQVRQNARLRRQNLIFDKQFAQFSHDLQYDMWKKTGPVGMVDQLEQAGLNPGLMYGMGGGGGQTTGSTTGQTSTSPNATPELSQAMAMMPQVALMAAQKENIEADTKLKEVEANKRAGVDTEAVKADIDAKGAIAELTRQQTDNARWEYEIKKLDKAFKEMELFEKQQSQDDRMDQIMYNSKILGKQLGLLENELAVSDATVKDKVKIIQADAIGAVLRNGLTAAQTSLTEQQMKKVINDILLEWKNLETEQEKLRLLNRSVQVQEGQEFNIIKSLDNIIVPMVLPTKGK